MKTGRKLATVLAAIAIGLSAMTPAAYGSDKIVAIPEVGPQPKSASAESLAARATVTPSATAYGGFALSSQTTVYILVRGPSLSTLGVTQNALDAPWVRLYNASGTDLISTGGRPGFTTCLGSAATDRPVVDYYQNVRNAPVHGRDSCLATTLQAGGYTFSVTPSLAGITSPTGVSSTPSSGEILFEVTLGPSAPMGTDQRSKTEQLVGGTWTNRFAIGSSQFADQYRFNSVQVSTSTPGEYFAAGVDEFGGAVVGTYLTSRSMWAILDPSIIIDKFFTFTFSDLNHISGCYYQVSPPGSTNLSSCYPMTGVRSPFKSLGAGRSALERDMEEVDAARAMAATDPPAPGRREQDQRLLEELQRMRAQ